LDCYLNSTGVARSWCCVSHLTTMEGGHGWEHSNQTKCSPLTAPDLWHEVRGLIRFKTMTFITTKS
jgi:hypothetical protein